MTTILLVFFAVLSLWLRALCVAQDRMIGRLIAQRMEMLLDFERIYTGLIEQIDPDEAERMRRKFARIHADFALQSCIPRRK